MKLVSSFITIAALILSLLSLVELSDAAFQSPVGATGLPSSDASTTTTLQRGQSSPRAKAPSTQVQFSGNSEVMLDTLCGYVPWPFRSLARTAFLKELQGLVGQHEITETHVYHVVLKLTPSKFHPQTMELLDHFKTAVSA